MKLKSPFRGMFICALYWQNLNKSKEFLHLLNLKYDNAVKKYFVRLFTLKHISYSIQLCCKNLLPLFVFENIFKLAPVGAFTFILYVCIVFFLQNISGRQSKVLHHEYSERHKMQAININSARRRVPAQYITKKLHWHRFTF